MSCGRSACRVAVFRRAPGLPYAAPRGRIVPLDESVTCLGDSVLVSGRQVGVGGVSGLEISEPVYVLNRMRDDQIVETHWHVERAEALRAAGLSED